MSFIRRHKVICSIALFFILVIIVGIIVFTSFTTISVPSDWSKIFFDVKLIRLNTTINVHKNDQTIGTVKGNIVRLITDPLTYYDLNDKKIAYADDTYHLIAQDSHAIIVNGTMTAEMVGKVKLFGEAYDIYNNNGEKVAYAEFDFMNIGGHIKDNNGNIVAEYRAHPILKDFTIYYSPDCMLDENTLIMLFSSYYSDHSIDSRNNNSSN